MVDGQQFEPERISLVSLYLQNIWLHNRDGGYNANSHSAQVPHKVPGWMSVT